MGLETLPRLSGVGSNTNGRETFGGDGNVLKWTVKMATQLSVLKPSNDTSKTYVSYNSKAVLELKLHREVHVLEWLYL